MFLAVLFIDDVVVVCGYVVAVVIATVVATVVAAAVFVGESGGVVAVFDCVVTVDAAGEERVVVVGCVVNCFDVDDVAVVDIDGVVVDDVVVVVVAIDASVIVVVVCAIWYGVIVVDGGVGLIRGLVEELCVVELDILAAVKRYSLC